MEPVVSIVLPTFNRLGYLREAIASVFAQSFQQWELLIADDGSDDETLAYLRALTRDPRIKLLQLTHSGNPPRVRNAALSHAQGRYVAFIDSDDIWLAEKLQHQMRALRAAAPGRRWSYTSFTLVDASRIPLAGAGQRGRQVMAGRILEPLLRMEVLIVQSSVVASRELLEEAGGYDESFPICGDYDLWLRLARRAEADLICEPLVLVRRHAEHYCDDIAACRDFLRVLDNTEQDVAPPIRALVRQRRAVRRTRTHARPG
jgi:glycosyltransferase involved in cell wall biosynthesis